MDIEFASRGYELDAEGLVPPHVFLQYMEHMRWENARREVSDLGSLMRTDRSFVVVSQTLHIAGDIGMATSMSGTVWIGRTGKTSMDFHHAIHRIGKKELLATGNTTIVCIDENGVPVNLPNRIGRASQDTSWTIDPQPPEFPEMPERLIERSYRVRTSDIDFLGHMNQAGYAGLYEDAHRTATKKNSYGSDGLGGGRMRLLHIEYVHSAVLGEEVSVGTWLAGTDPVTIGFVMRRGNTLLSRAVARM